MFNEEIKKALEQAIGMAWDEFKAEHPAQAGAFEMQFGDPVAIVVTELKKDATYDELLAKTEQETNIANIVKALAPIITNIVGMIL